MFTLALIRIELYKLYFFTLIYFFKMLKLYNIVIGTQYRGVLGNRFYNFS